MKPLLLAVGGIGVLALANKLGLFEPAKRLNATIVIGGTPDNPRVKKCPKRLIAAPTDSITWDIYYQFDDGASGSTEVWLTGFRRKGEKRKIFKGDDADRKNTKDPKVIRDIVADYLELPKSAHGLYQYDVYLNNKRAKDPDIRIKEAG